MHARVSFYGLAPGADPEGAAKGFENSADAVQQMEGNQGLMLLVDREGGTALSLTFWDTEDHLRASAAQAGQLRQQAAEAAQVSIEDVKNFEVALDRGR